MIKLVLALLFALLFTCCANRTTQATDEQTDKSAKFQSEVHQEFVNNLASLCGKSFPGEQTYRSHHGESWAHREMIMHVTLCEDDKVYIPFHIDDDYSRTWIFVAEEGKLRFKHQHLHEDGTPEEGSMYGGYADERGTAFIINWKNLESMPGQELMQEQKLWTWEKLEP